jgi:hypothetical protein
MFSAECAHAVLMFDQFLQQVGTQKSGGTGDEYEWL